MKERSSPFDPPAAENDTDNGFMAPWQSPHDDDVLYNFPVALCPA